MTQGKSCCVPNCRRDIGERAFASWDESICADHVSLVCDSTREALCAASRRLARLEAAFGSQVIFDRVVARGRYLQFCELIAMAHDRVDRAWSRVKAEAITGAFIGRQLEPVPSSNRSRSRELAG